MVRPLLKVGLVLLLVFTALYFAANAFGAPDIEEIARWLESARGESPWLAATVVTGLLVLDLFLSIPTMAVTLLAGHWLGFVPGALAASIGMGAAGILGYGLSRQLGERALGWILPEEREREALRAEFAKRGFVLILLSRAVPMLPEISACLSGVTRMPLPRFLAAWAAGTIPYALVASYCGSVSSTGTQALFAALALWGALWIAGFVYSKKTGRSHGTAFEGS